MGAPGGHADTSHGSGRYQLCGSQLQVTILLKTFNQFGDPSLVVRNHTLRLSDL